jgi:hypothetical protein
VDVLAALLPLCDASLVPFGGRQISIYVRLGVSLAMRTGLGDFIGNQFSNPVSRSAPMPAAFSNGQMQQANIPSAGGVTICPLSWGCSMTDQWNEPLECPQCHQARWSACVSQETPTRRLFIICRMASKPFTHRAAAQVA